MVYNAVSSFCSPGIILFKVNDILTERKNKHMTWWLDTLHCVEQNKETSSELIRKIGEAISGTLNTSKTSKISSWLVFSCTGIAVPMPIFNQCVMPKNASSTYVLASNLSVQK